MHAHGRAHHGHFAYPAPTRISVGGIGINHVDAGPRDAAVVVLLPGIIATHRYFRANIGPLSRRYRVLALDMPGFGRSDKPDVTYSVDWFVRMLVGFLDDKGVGRAHLVGNSLGGQIALMAALAEPARFDKLVLVAPAGISTHSLRAARPLLQVIGRAPVHVAGVRAVPRVPGPAVSLLFRAVFPGSPELAARYARGYRNAVDSEEYPLFMRALVRAAEGCLAEPVLHHARLVEHDTLIIWGRRDLLLPVGAARLLHRNMPRAHLLVYERSGHVPMADEPERFNRDVLAHLDGKHAG